MNIALVVLDTLRYDAFVQHFDWLPGVRIKNAWAPSYWTVPSHAALFTGYYPSEVGIHARNTTFDCPQSMLAEDLHDAGYTTRAFSNNVNLTPVSSFDRGFDHFHGGWRIQNLTANTFDWETFVSETRNEGMMRYLRGIRQCITNDCATWPSLKRGGRLKLRDLGLDNQPDDNGIQETLNYVRETEFGEQEFLFINLMEAHWPYQIPDSFGNEEVDDLSDASEYNGLVATLGGGPPIDGERLRRAYDRSVDYLSTMYRSVFAELRDDFDVIFTVSDHGELFGESGGWQHAYGIRPELTRVPVVVSGDQIGNESDEQPTTLLDVHRTILSLANVEGSSKGRVLPYISDDPPTDEERNVYTESHGLNQRSVARAQTEGYDPSLLDHELTGVATPIAYGYEDRDGFGVENKNDDLIVDSSLLKESIETHRNRINRRTVSQSDEASKELQRQLEALGYA
ncbi:sulfatase-like hydrolase/transferase [Halococcus sediminicola]|uniref:sulfatase-like hydrolase/transferase n=1 Tax=Halococcus sediminicola TaxID=1264579 RepID=UPI000678AEFA|nr:sulfatase-like hydrolase/transferase [Halococcus sediminicola]